MRLTPKDESINEEKDDALARRQGAERHSTLFPKWIVRSVRNRTWTKANVKSGGRSGEGGTEMRTTIALVMALAASSLAFAEESQRWNQDDGANDLVICPSSEYLRQKAA